MFTKAAFGKGDRLPRIKVKTKDEIGQISIAYNEMAQALEEHNKQEKELKNAAEEQSWLNTKIAEIATMYPGINHLKELAQLFITRLAPIVGASYGIIYMKENSVFRKYGLYASEDEQVGRESFRVGEGLVGQCALDRRLFRLMTFPRIISKFHQALAKRPQRASLSFLLNIREKCLQSLNSLHLNHSLGLNRCCLRKSSAILASTSRVS